MPYNSFQFFFIEFNSIFVIILFKLFFFQTELSHNLQQLSERARSTTEFIQRLKGMSDKVNVSIRISF